MEAVTAAATSAPTRGMPESFSATTTAPAFAAASAPFCAIRCCANALPPSTTSATIAISAKIPIAKITRIWPAAFDVRGSAMFIDSSPSWLSWAVGGCRVCRDAGVGADKFDGQLRPAHERDRSDDVPDQWRDRLPEGFDDHHRDAADGD